MNNEQVKFIDFFVASIFYTNMEFYTYTMQTNAERAQENAEIISLLKQINEKLEKLID